MDFIFYWLENMAILIVPLGFALFCYLIARECVLTHTTPTPMGKFFFLLFGCAVRLGSFFFCLDSVIGNICISIIILVARGCKHAALNMSILSILNGG